MLRVYEDVVNCVLLAWARAFIGRVLAITRIMLAGGSRQNCQMPAPCHDSVAAMETLTRRQCF